MSKQFKHADYNSFENLFHFIWRYKLLKPGPLLSMNGSKLKILNPGELNKDAGPDFFNAKIEIDDIMLAGNVEIHVNSSDWIKHGHEKDKSYDNLILHIVYNYDKAIPQNSANNVEVLELKNYVDDSVLKKYKALVSSVSTLPCSKQIKNVDELKLRSWIQRMLIERLESKTDYAKHLFEASQNDFTQTFYLMLARNFGFKINGEPFELLAKHLPIQILLKHSANSFQLEGLLYGVAGFLSKSYKNKYLQQLQNEFEFLKNKYKLVELDVSLWKMLRLMPANFPTVRIWQFAMLIHKCPELFSSPEKFNTVETLSKAITFKHEGYWGDHYIFDGKSVKNVKAIGRNSIQNLITNTFAPFLFFYGKKTGNDKLIDAAAECFHQLPFEDNHKTRHFVKAGLKFETSAESQGLINLFDNYCKNKLCLQCGVASNLLLNRI
ncbi:MAG TPA: DUF2851 family protein [Bacteroidia bacterium]|jgi:hypothetical protein|nr:DUF2851 family protein [Bacteroidia bacterium]